MTETENRCLQCLALEGRGGVVAYACSLMKALLGMQGATNCELCLGPVDKKSREPCAIVPSMILIV